MIWQDLLNEIERQNKKLSVSEPEVNMMKQHQTKKEHLGATT